MFICMSVRDFAACQRHNKQHSLCSNRFSDAGQGSRMILSATKGTSFHLTTCSRYCSLSLHLSSPLLSLLFPSLSAVRLLCLPTISALRCTQEEECCSAMRHMHIAQCGMLLTQITHSTLGAKAVAHNKTAILIATYSTYSFLLTKQTNTANNVGTQRTSAIGITSVWNIMAVQITAQRGHRYQNTNTLQICYQRDPGLCFFYHLFTQRRVLLSMHARTRLRAAECCATASQTVVEGVETYIHPFCPPRFCYQIQG